MPDYFGDLVSPEPAPTRRVPPDLPEYQAQAEARTGLPPGVLVALAQTESSGDPSAVGPPTKYGRARGLYQFIPPTAAQFGLDDPHDPYAATDAAAEKFSGLVQRYGDVETAAKAWNWGEGNLASGKPEPTETRNFAARLLSNLRKGEAPSETPPDYFGDLATPPAADVPSRSTALPAPEPLTPPDYFGDLVSPEPAQGEPPSALESFGRQAARAAVPAATGLGGAITGAEAGAALGSLGGPVGMAVGGIVGGLAGGLGGGYIGSEFQDTALQTYAPEFHDELAAKTKLDRETHPIASLAGELAPGLATMRPSLSGVAEAGGTLRDLFTKGGREALKALPSEALAAKLGTAANVAGGAALGGGMEGRAQLEEGEFDPWRLLLATAAGASFNRANRLGRALGLEGPARFSGENAETPVAPPGPESPAGTVSPPPSSPRQPGDFGTFDVQTTPQGEVIVPRTDIFSELPAAPGEARAPVSEPAPAEPIPSDAIPPEPPRPEPVPSEPIPTDTIPPEPPRSESIPPESAPGEAVSPEPAAPVEPAPQPRRSGQAYRDDAAELERLATETNNARLRAQLLEDARSLRRQGAEADTPAPAKLSPQERADRNRRIDTEKDDLITAIRKLGGIDVNLESDWAGRLSHLKPEGFGLKGIEQARGGGRSLDDLAEVLHEHGYLQNRDKRELEALLSDAESGRKSYSSFKQTFGDVMQAPDTGPRFDDRDFSYRDPTDFVETPDGVSARDPSAFQNMDADFYILDDHGELVPARPFAENDLAALIEEQRHAEDWYAKEGEGAAQEPVSPIVGEPAQRPGTGPAAGPPEQPGGLQDAGALRLHGGLGDTLEGRADYQPETAKTPEFALEGQAPPAERPGPAKPAETADLFGSKDAIAQALHDERLKREAARQGQAEPPADGGRAADLFGAGGKQTDFATRQETSPFGPVYRQFHHDAPGAVAHLMAQQDGEAIGALHHPEIGDIDLVWGKAGNPAKGYKGGYGLAKISAKHPEVLPRLGELIENAKLLPAKADESAWRFLETTHDRAIVRLDWDGQTKHWLVSAYEKKAGAGGTSDIAELGGKAGTAPLSSGPSESIANVKPGDQPGPGTLGANLFLSTGREIARAVIQHPNQSAIAALGGGIAGGVTSDEKPFSSRWWLDVALGAAVGTTVYGAGRRYGAFGKGSLPSRAYDYLAKTVNGLPLIGAGPEDVRGLKRSQRSMEALIKKQAGEIGAELLRRYTPADRAMMADLIETRGIVPDLNLVHRQAQELENFISAATEQMKGLGMLREDTEIGGYLHRYYTKHLFPSAEQKRARDQGRLAGSWSIERGTDGSFHQDYFSPEARKTVDQWRGVTAELADVDKELAKWDRKYRAGMSGDDPDLFLDKYREATEPLRERRNELLGEKKDLEQTEFHEFLGMENDKPKSFLFAKDEVPRVPNELKPPKGQLDQPPAGSLDTRTLPQAPIGELHGTNRVWTLRGAKGAEGLFHRDWTPAERTKWGEIRDAGYRLVRGMSEVAHDLSLYHLFDRVARNGQWVSDTAKQMPVSFAGKDWFKRDYVQVPKTTVRGSSLKVYGPLAGKYVRPDVWAGIRNYGRPSFGSGPVMNAYRSALSIWRKFKTVYNPVTSFNNLYSNVEMFLMGGYSPRDMAEGLRYLKPGTAEYGEARDAGLFNTDFVAVDLGGGEAARNLQELQEALRNQPEIADGVEVTGAMTRFHGWLAKQVEAIGTAEGRGGKAKALARAGFEAAATAARPVGRALATVDDAAQRLYRVQDVFFKTAVYAAERRKGASSAEAARRAEELYFDYADIPEAIKIARDFPIGSPFITYTYKAVPAIAKLAIEHPEKVFAMAMAYHALNYWGMATTSPDQAPEYWKTRQAEEELSPSWDRGVSMWGAPNIVHLPYVDSYRLALGRSHAGGNPFMDEAGGKRLPQLPLVGSAWGPTLLGSNPILGTALDLAMNEDWKGNPIWEPGAPAGEKTSKALAYLYQAATPSNVLTPGGYQQSRVLEGLANEAASRRAANQPEGIAGGVVDMANAVSEALGFGQFTGLDRAGNEILTRDAWLASFGIKLRPERWDQGLDMGLRDIQAQRKATADYLRKRTRDYSQARLTEKQIGQASDFAGGEGERQTEAEGKKFDARAWLNQMGR